MAFEIKGPSGDVVTVNGDKELEVALAKSLARAGYAVMIGESDDGTITGNASRAAFEVSADYRMRAGIDTMASSWQFPGSAIDTTIWTAPATAMTLAVANGFATLNAGNSNAANAVVQLTSRRCFPAWGSFTTWAEMNVQFGSLPVAGSVCEWGFCIATGVTTPTDGSFFRIDANGNFYCVLNYNGIELQSGNLDFIALVDANTTRTFLVGLHNTSVTFWIDDVKVAEFQLAASAAAMNSAVELPIMFRNYNGPAGAGGSGQQMRVGACNVTLGEYHGTKQHEQIMAGMGGCCYQGQTGGTLGTTAANMANSAALPAAVVPTNTTAALGSGLGGFFHELETNPPAVNTDLIISSYQVPAIVTNAVNKMLYVTGVHIESYVDAAIIGGGYSALWQVAFGGTAVSLATAESATTKAFRKIPIGNQFVAANATVGTVLSTIDRTFQTPIPVQPGEFFQVIKRKIGTAPTGPTGSLIHSISIVGYFE